MEAICESNPGQDDFIQGYFLPSVLKEVKQIKWV